jgi:hypothetical protein
VPPPDIHLPAQLSTLGELSQPFDTTDPRPLQDASVRAATAIYPDVAGAQADAPVAIAASKPALHDALVVPLSQSRGDSGAREVAALVVFLRDCTGQAYFDQVADLLHLDPSIQPAHFPVVSVDEARARLGSDAARLIWRRSPLQPLWVDPRSGRTIDAGPPLPNGAPAP